VKRQRGVALLLVLWAFMVLGVLALDFSGWMREDARAGVNFAEETQAYYEAHAAQQIALENARRRMEDAQGDGDLLEEERGEFHGVPWEVTVRPECGRIPLNYIARKAAGEGGEPGEPEAPAAREVLKRVVTNLLHGGNRTRGMDNRTAKEIDAIVDAILDWVDSDTEERPNGADEPWYEANRGYLPRGYPFLAPEELLGVKGVTPVLFYGSSCRCGAAASIPARKT
jgi:type II secretory pathway component PulK